LLVRSRTLNAFVSWILTALAGLGIIAAGSAIGCGLNYILTVFILKENEPSFGITKEGLITSTFVFLRSGLIVAVGIAASISLIYMVLKVLYSILEGLCECIVSFVRQVNQELADNPIPDDLSYGLVAVREDYGSVQ